MKKYVIRLMSLLSVVLISVIGWGHASLASTRHIQSDDHDDDGIVNSSDVDDDSDGIPDAFEKDKYKNDHDNDEILDSVDTDDDNDGIEDSEDDDLLDHNNDGTPDVAQNRLTTKSKDSDADGFKDRVEKSTFQNDHDNDEIADETDTDDDNDGIEDSTETSDNLKNHDDDSQKDKRDLDDDGDGIRDYNEDGLYAWDDENNDGVQDDQGDDNEGDSQTTDVSIQYPEFSDSSVTITVGDSVTWTNEDEGMDHTVTADDSSFDSGTLSQNDTFTKTFDKAGTYTYHCSIHPEMTGTVVVETDSNEDN